MNQVIRRVLTAGAVSTAFVGTVLAAAPAQACACPDRVPVEAHATDDSVKSGEQFRIKGRVHVEDRGIADAVVRIQTRRDGDWEPIRGAVVRSGDNGYFSVRVILQQKGDRQLRVVANPKQQGMANGFERVAVHVS